MRKIELTSLLPASAIPNQTQQGVLQDLATTTFAGGSIGTSPVLVVRFRRR